MKLKTLLTITAAAAAIGVPAQTWRADESLTLGWGDQGDGTYINPVLNADYSDPDVIRVDSTYYLVCSDFHFMGMPVLRSYDLVNWQIIARVHDSLPGYDGMDMYAKGTWAPAIRYHDGLFYIYVCSPSEGLWVTTATDPAGEWAPMRLVKAVERWEDPCPFWDAEGNAYLGRSQYGAGPIIIHRMSHDGMELLDDGVTVYEGPVAEGTKIYEIDGYVYISIPEGGVHGGWQTVLRGRSVYGPFERRVVLEQGSTDVNGPHQGALVDTPGGEWWFVHFQETPILGRVMHMQPVTWVDGFPAIGTDYDGNGVGEPMRRVPKPNTGCAAAPSLPQTDDDFSGPGIGVQWQFNHNPVMECFDLSSRPGHLVWTPLPADSIRNARNTLTQRLMGYRGRAVAEFDVSAMSEGQRCGVVSMGKHTYGAGVMAVGGALMMYTEHGDSVMWADMLRPDDYQHVYIAFDYDVKANRHAFWWSTDGVTFTPIGRRYAQRWGNWKGERVGLYNYCRTPGPGRVAVDSFTMQCLE